jgi:hypothetical protein
MDGAPAGVGVLPAGGAVVRVFVDVGDPEGAAESDRSDPPGVSPKIRATVMADTTKRASLARPLCASPLPSRRVISKDPLSPRIAPDSRVAFVRCVPDQSSLL